MKEREKREEVGSQTIHLRALRQKETGQMQEGERFSPGTNEGRGEKQLGIKSGTDLPHTRHQIFNTPPGFPIREISR